MLMHTPRKEVVEVARIELAQPIEGALLTWQCPFSPCNEPIGSVAYSYGKPQRVGVARIELAQPRRAHYLQVMPIFALCKP